MIQLSVEQPPAFLIAMWLRINATVLVYGHSTPPCHVTLMCVEHYGLIVRHAQDTVRAQVRWLTWHSSYGPHSLRNIYSPHSTRSSHSSHSPHGTYSTHSTHSPHSTYSPHSTHSPHSPHSKSLAGYRTPTKRAAPIKR